ncbi:hypothetical protein [Mesorhizobium sp. M0496]
MDRVQCCSQTLWAAGVPGIPNCNLPSGFTWIRPLTAGTSTP